jgi:REP element-mobilizing transposase RayT
VTLFNNKYRIESSRKPGWDYSRSGYYFITVCTCDRNHLFGEVIGGKMIINSFGEIVNNEWIRSFEIRCELIRDEFTVMPNHFHGIVQIRKPLSANNSANTNPVGMHGQTENVNPVGTRGQTENVDPVGTRGQTENVDPVGTRGQTENVNPVETHGRASLPTGIAYRAPKSVSSFMAGMKSIITKRINEIRNTPRADVLQARFHDHVIRNEDELNRIRQYIRNNPRNWGEDRFNSTFKNIVSEECAGYGLENWMNIV